MIKGGLRRLQLTEPFHRFYKAVLRGKEGLSGEGGWCVLCVCALLTSALCSPLLCRSLFTGNVRGASCLAAWYRVTQSLFWEEKLACQAGHRKACRQSIKYSICHSNIIDLITQKSWSLKKKAVRFQRRFIGLRDLFKYDLIDSSAPCVRVMGNGMDFLPGKHGANVHEEWKFKSALWPLGKRLWPYKPHNRGEREDVFLNHYPFSITSIFSLSSGYFSSVFFLLVSFLPPGRDCAHGWPHALGSRYCFSITVAYGPLLPITTTQSQISVINSPQPYGQSTLPLHSLLKIMDLNAISITVPSIITQKLHKISENVLNNQSLLSKHFTFRHLLN